MSVRIDASNINNDNDGPFVAMFPHGSPPDLNEMDFVCHEMDKNRVIKGQAEHADYLAGNFQSTPQQMFAVGMVTKSDSSHRVVKLLKVNHIYQFQQKMKLTTFHVDSSDSEIETHFERTGAAIDAFGSKKRKRRLNSERLTRVNLTDDTFARDAIAAATSSMVDEDLKKDMSPYAAGNMLPEFDEETRDVYNIYPLNGMIPRYLYNELKDIVEPIKELVESDETTKTVPYPSFIMHFIKKLKSKEIEDDEQLEACQLIAFVHSLMKMYCLSFGSYSGKSLLESHNIPEAVGHHLCKTFLIPKSKFYFQMSNAAKNKILCYLCILGLRLDGHHLSSSTVDMLSNNLSLETSNVRTILTNIGAKRDGQSYSLKAPLVLPRIRKVGRK